MTASVERVKLPFPTDATETGPIIEYRNSSVLVKYDHMEFNGAIKWVSLTFADVLAYEVCEGVCCSVETVIPSGVIEARKESAWLTQIVERWKETVGWQQYQQDLGGEKRFNITWLISTMCVLFKLLPQPTLSTQMNDKKRAAGESRDNRATSLWVSSPPPDTRELAQSCGRSGFFVEGNTLRGKYDIPDLSIFVKPLRDLDVDFPRLKLRPKHGLFEMIVDTSNEERSEHKKRRLIFQLRA